MQRCNDRASRSPDIPALSSGHFLARRPQPTCPCGGVTKADWPPGQRKCRDASSQLVQEQRNGTQALDTTYSYDPVGNRTLLLDSGSRTSSSYDAANQLSVSWTATTRTTYSHDNCGNRTQQNSSSGITYYTWDARGKLAVTQPPSGQ